MLRSVMLSRIFAIILLLLVSVPIVVEAAPLTFGAAPGTTRGLDTEEHARQLATELAAVLGDKVSTRLFDNQLQLGQWLNQFAMIDLGVMDAAFLASHPGEFLVLGSPDRSDRLFVVTRQGATGDVPQRVAAALRRIGGRPASAPSPEVKVPVKTVTSPVVAGRQPATGPIITEGSLVLGLVVGRDGVVRDPVQADQLAAQLGNRLGVPLQIRLFDNERALADWFNRFRMIDLAVIAEPGRRDPLVGDYHPLRRLTVPGGEIGLLVARRDLPADRLENVKQVLVADNRELNFDKTGVTPAVESSGVVAMAAPPLPVPAAAPEVLEVPQAVPSAPVTPLEEQGIAPAPETPGEPVTAVSPVVSPEVETEIASSPAISPLPESVESFQLPASIGPLDEFAGTREQPPTPTARPESSLIPDSAAPVESALLPTVAAATAPEALPEQLLSPVPQQVTKEVPPPVLEQEVALTTPEAVDTNEEAPTAAPAVATPAPETSIVPAPASTETAVEESLLETVAELPFVPVPSKGDEDVPPPVSSREPAAVEPVIASSEAVASSMEKTVSGLAGADKVPAVIAQPDLPQELRPPGIPLPRPGRMPKAPSPSGEPLLLEDTQKPLARTPKPLPLLPEPEPEPGVIYIAPFITLMVPAEVHERIFDQFVDTLNRRGAARQLKFVILKQGIDKIDRAWLGARKYALGEIYGYVEEAGCCSTDLRTRVRLTYYRPRETTPALKFEYPVRTFFDHDQSTLAAERQKLADKVAVALVDELFKALQP